MEVIIMELLVLQTLVVVAVAQTPNLQLRMPEDLA